LSFCSGSNLSTARCGAHLLVNILFDFILPFFAAVILSHYMSNYVCFREIKQRKKVNKIFWNLLRHFYLYFFLETIVEEFFWSFHKKFPMNFIFFVGRWNCKLKFSRSNHLAMDLKIERVESRDNFFFLSTQRAIIHSNKNQKTFLVFIFF
jgi:hypothetical protein